MEERVLAKLNLLKEAGFVPYSARFLRTHTAIQILSETKDWPAGEKRPAMAAAIAGRLAGLRLMGKTCFGHLQDGTGRVQVYLRQDELGTNYQLFVRSEERRVGKE